MKVLIFVPSGAGKTYVSQITWGDWLGQEAQKRNIPFIDATLSPNEIFAIISR